MVPLESIPPAGTNNFWYTRPDERSVVVFVHGIHSDSRDCWLLEEGDLGGKSTSILQAVHQVYWPRLIAEDDDFKEFGVISAAISLRRGQKIMVWLIVRQIFTEN